MITEEERLEVTVQVFKAICAQMKEPSTFRDLIYGKLGFAMSTYKPLYLAGGMEISNACHDLKGET